MDEGERFASRGSWHEAGISFRQAALLRTDDPVAFFNLGAAFSALGQEPQAALCYLKAQKHAPEGSGCWAHATAAAFDLLRLKECSAMVKLCIKPTWWNDEELKIVSARVVMAAPNFEGAHRMVAIVLSGLCDGVWEVGPRSAAELKDAAAHFELSVALCGAHSAELARCADWCRRQALLALAAVPVPPQASAAPTVAARGPGSLSAPAPSGSELVDAVAARHERAASVSAAARASAASLGLLEGGDTSARYIYRAARYI